MLDPTRTSQSSQQGEAVHAHGARGTTLAPFRVPSFRFQWPADPPTSWAFEMENLILGWYVLVETGSCRGSRCSGAQYSGTLIAPMMGVTSDRIGHRNLLIGMRAIYALLAATQRLSSSREPSR